LLLKFQVEKKKLKNPDDTNDKELFLQPKNIEITAYKKTIIIP